MTHTLDSFAARVREILQKEDNPAGREKVAALLRDALGDRAFVESLFDGTSPERKVLYEDPQLGFCILAHRYTDARNSPPHGHGPSWAIYGQADGETVMTDWALVEAPSRRQAREGEEAARIHADARPRACVQRGRACTPPAVPGRRDWSASKGRTWSGSRD